MTNDGLPSFHGAPRQTTPGQAGRMVGSLRVFGDCSELWQFSVSGPFSPQPPLIPTVGRPMPQ